MHERDGLPTILRNRSWVWEGSWWGPQKGRGKAGRKSRGPGTPIEAYEDLRRDPNGYNWEPTRETWQPVPRFIEAICVDDEDFDFTDKSLGRRLWVQRRKAILMYLSRHFVDQEATPELARPRISVLSVEAEQTPPVPRLFPRRLSPAPRRRPHPPPATVDVPWHQPVVHGWRPDPATPYGEAVVTVQA